MLINNFCTDCIDYFKNNPPSKGTDFIKKNIAKIGTFLTCENNSVLFYAPAGNFPIDPVVTICGLATSIQAKDFLQCRIEKDKHQVERYCLQTVYRGTMAVNLMLVLNAIGVNRLLKKNVGIKIVQNDTCAEVNMQNMKSEHFGCSGNFISVPDNLHLTQSTCCWSQGGSAKFQRKWIEYSQHCREEGYLKACLSQFLTSENSKLFIFLGRENMHNINIIKKIIKETESNIKILYPQGLQWAKKKNIENINNICVKDKKFTKIICFIHHPANTGYVYNNQSKVASPKSLLFNYFNSNCSWEFTVEKYGQTKKETMASVRDYYSQLFDMTGKLRQH